MRGSAATWVAQRLPFADDEHREEVAASVASLVAERPRCERAREAASLIGLWLRLWGRREGLDDARQAVRQGVYLGGVLLAMVFWAVAWSHVGFDGSGQGSVALAAAAMSSGAAGLAAADGVLRGRRRWFSSRRMVNHRKFLPAPAGILRPWRCSPGTSVLAAIPAVAPRRRGRPPAPRATHVTTKAVGATVVVSASCRWCCWPSVASMPSAVTATTAGTERPSRVDGDLLTVDQPLVVCAAVLVGPQVSWRVRRNFRCDPEGLPDESSDRRLLSG